MLKDVWLKITSFFDKDITNELRERVTNPFFVALSFSWVAWNWELIFMLFNFDSQFTLDDKVGRLQNYIKNDPGKWMLLWWPLIYALGAIVLFSTAKQASLVINLIFLNWIQPFLHKVIGSSNIIDKNRFDKIKRSAARLRNANSELNDELTDITEENQNLKLKSEQSLEKLEELRLKIDEWKYKYEGVSKNSLEGLFEGPWTSEFIFPNGTEGQVRTEIREGNKWFENEKYIFNVDMIEANHTARTLKFRKVGIEGDKRKLVNNLTIENDFEYRGVEEAMTIITYTKIGSQKLVFKPFYTKRQIDWGENNNLNFKFFNNGNGGLELLSYEFKAYHNGTLFMNSPKHPFNKNLPGNKELVEHFGEVEPLGYYFGNKQEHGVFDSEITIEFRMDGSADIQRVTRVARLVVETKIKVLSATYGAASGIVDVTPTVSDLVTNNNGTIMVTNENLLAPSKLLDPTPGIVKTLHVRYMINGRQKVSISQEGMECRLS